MRTLSYAMAINEALHQLMETDERVFILGQGVNNPWYVGKTATGLFDRFGPSRVIDPPISESGMNGFGVGAALAGRRPIVIHPRVDFMLVGTDQIINQASNWSYVFRGQIGVPVTYWGIVNRGGEQGAQHSQAMQAMYMHIPGLKVVMPATPEAAKGLLVAAIRDGNPVMYLDDRWLYTQEGHVPEPLYETPIGKAAILREGTDVTIAATSWMVVQAMEAGQRLAPGISVEVIDVRSLKPLDVETLARSVRKTGRLVVADAAWRTAGAAAEIAASVSEAAFGSLVAPIQRVTLPDTPAPSSSSEESAYYPTAATIEAAVRRVVK